MSVIETEYTNTDFDLKSTSSFDTLHRELERSCKVRSHVHGGGDGNWHAIVNAAHEEDSRQRDAAKDILSMVEAITALSPTAKAELDACYLREFNIGFDCGDSWGYVHQLPLQVVRDAADAGCSIAVTLYPMRNPDGTPKEPE